MGENDDIIVTTSSKPHCIVTKRAKKTQQVSELPNRQFVTPNEVAAYLRVSAKTVYRWCEIGYLISVKLNRTVRIQRESVLIFAAGLENT